MLLTCPVFHTFLLINILENDMQNQWVCIGGYCVKPSTLTIRYLLGKLLFRLRIDFITAIKRSVEDSILLE